MTTCPQCGRDPFAVVSNCPDCILAVERAKTAALREEMTPLGLAELQHWKQRAEKAVEELTALNTQFDELQLRLVKAESELHEVKNKTYCAYCGEEYLLDADTCDKVGKHIATCPKHPMRIIENKLIMADADAAVVNAVNADLREKLAQAESAVAEMREALQEINKASEYIYSAKDLGGMAREALSTLKDA